MSFVILLAGYVVLFPLIILTFLGFVAWVRESREHAHREAGRDEMANRRALVDEARRNACERITADAIEELRFEIELYGPALFERTRSEGDDV